MDGFKIVWSSLAQIDLIEIMEYYFHRNKSMKVSEDLSLKIYADIEKLSFNPFLGISSDMHNVRLLISGHYKIIYEILESEILIVLIWDSRRNPEDFKLTMTKRI